MTKARQRANLEGSEDFITDPELISEANTSIAKWYDLVRSTTWGGQQYRSRWNFTTSPAQTNQSPYASPPPGSFYTLPDDFLHLISVDVAISATLVVTAQAAQEEQRNRFKFYPLGSWTLGQPVYYMLQGQNIVFIPAPLGSFNVQVNYCPTAPRLAKPDDYIDSINSWEEHIVLDLGIKMLIKDGQIDMVQLLQGRQAEEERRIKALVPKRDMQTAEMVHEYGSPFDDPWFW